LDLPGWQAIYQQLKNKNFEIVSVAQDTGGAKAAGPWIDPLRYLEAKPDLPKETIETARKIGPLSYTVLIDEKHLVSKLYNMVNVPTGVWINEKGRIIRPNEVAFVDDRFKNFSGLDSAPYLSALKDWVERGEKSAYVMSEDRLREKLAAQDPSLAMAAAEFGLGEQLYKSGHAAEAIPHFKEAQRLNPRSWSYKRQAWALSDAKRDYGTSFKEEVDKIGGSKVYYTPPDLPQAEKKPEKPQ
jgi:tetratricopeptide (TPR) repeat protein